MYPFQYWQIDHIDLQSISGNAKKAWKYVLVIIDIFSKFVYLYPCNSTKLEEVVGILQKIFLNGDIPEIIGCDQAFNKPAVAELCKVYGIELRPSTPHNPQTNGFVENKNKHIKKLIQLYLAKGFKGFVNALDHIAFTLNNTKHSVILHTPQMIHRGRDIHIKSPIIDPDIVSKTNNNVVNNVVSNLVNDVVHNAVNNVFSDVVNNNIESKPEESPKKSQKTNMKTQTNYPYDEIMTERDKNIQKEYKKYLKVSKEMHKVRVDRARYLIHTTATKREIAFKESAINAESPETNRCSRT